MNATCLRHSPDVGRCEGRPALKGERFAAENASQTQGRTMKNTIGDAALPAHEILPALFSASVCSCAFLLFPVLLYHASSSLSLSLSLSINVSMYLCIYLSSYLSSYLSMYMYVCMHMHLLHTYTYVYIYVCVHASAMQRRE